MTIIRINVTKEIIERAKLCGHIISNKIENCAIALAVRDIFPGAKVGSDIISFPVTDNLSHAAMLPYIARTFIKVFDKTSIEGRLNLKPISFNIIVPEEVVDNISIEEITSRLERQSVKHVELVN